MPETITISYSELDTARQCLFKHDLAYRGRWRAPDTSPALSRGTLWHAVMESHYRTLMVYQQAARAGDDWGEARLQMELRRAVMPHLYDPSMRQTEQQELVEWMYTGYLEHYGLDPDYTILAVEHAPEVWLPTDRGGRSRFKLKLKIDLVVRWQGKIWLLDHKSGKDLPKKKELDIDDQFGLYTWAMVRLGRPVLGSIHSAARTHRNKDQTKHPQPLETRFLRTPLYRTPRELEAIALDAYKTAVAMYRWEPGEAPRSPNTDTCRWRCDYTESCLASRKGIALVTDHLRDLGFVQDFTRH